MTERPSTSGSRPLSAANSSLGITSAAQGDAKFADMYEKALLRKRLFKEYIQRNQVLERFNAAIEALFDSDVLPEDPVAWIAEWVVKNPGAVVNHGWAGPGGSQGGANTQGWGSPVAIPTTIGAGGSRPTSARTGLSTRVSSGGMAAAGQKGAGWAGSPS